MPRPLLRLFFAVMSTAFLFTGWGVQVSQAEEKEVSSDDVVVRRLEGELPTNRGKLNEFLWDSFANKPDSQQFESVQAKEWRETFTRYATQLVRKAKSQSLDYKSLDKCLDVVLADSGKGRKYAYLPVGAYSAKHGRVAVWIVVVRWEYDMGNEAQSFGHIQMFAFDAATRKLLGFNTCG